MFRNMYIMHDIFTKGIRKCPNISVKNCENRSFYVSRSFLFFSYTRCKFMVRKQLQGQVLFYKFVVNCSSERNLTTVSFLVYSFKKAELRG